ncbi:cation diffusion facilitator family transporter [Terrabacter tumescens]|uniref:cation diffusion facilitator family transporter n=1 Tax=Terrabacter tumescens TaxID=60443 RepID=UPI0004BF4A57|nr:cation diffusion facilitator family transporter [Terrabacter tumescens]
MSHGHGHGHGHRGGVSAAGAHRWRLQLAFGLVAVFFVVELVVGLTSRSLALISDAGHMAADVVALGAALVATRIATRKDTTGRRTFGSYRAEVFASGLAVLLMLGVAVYICIEAVGRIGAEPEVASGPMLVVGALGLVINLISIALLRAGASESLNVKGAYLEVLADTLGSVGVIAAAVLVGSTGRPWWDTVVALAIALFVAVRAVLLGREVLAVLGQHAPAGMHPDEAERALSQIDGVVEVHDLHVWTLTSGMNVATAHLVTAAVGPGESAADTATILAQAADVMRERFGIEHATLQVEPSGSSACTQTSW